MTRQPSPSLADKLAELVDKLLGQPVQPATVPVTVGRPQPVRSPVGRR